jgi:hypothetical protein
MAPTLSESEKSADPSAKMPVAEESRNQIARTPAHDLTQFRRFVALLALSVTISLGASLVLRALRGSGEASRQNSPLIRGSRNVFVSLPFSGITLWQVSSGQKPHGRPEYNAETRREASFASGLPRMWRRLRRGSPAE